MPSPLPESGLGLWCFNQQRIVEVLGLSLKKAWPCLLYTLRALSCHVSSPATVLLWPLEPHGEGEAHGTAEKSPTIPVSLANLLTKWVTPARGQKQLTWAQPRLKNSEEGKKKGQATAFWGGLSPTIGNHDSSWFSTDAFLFSKYKTITQMKRKYDKHFPTTSSSANRLKVTGHLLRRKHAYSPKFPWLFFFPWFFNGNAKADSRLLTVWTTGLIITQPKTEAIKWIIHYWINNDKWNCSHSHRMLSPFPEHFPLKSAVIPHKEKNNWIFKVIKRKENANISRIWITIICKI